MKLHRPTLIVSLIISSMAFVHAAHGCNIPVFRYALENWRPDPYLVFVVHRGELTPEQTALLRRLQQARLDSKSPANISVHEIDVSASPDTSQRQELPLEIKEHVVREFADHDLNTPRIVAYYPLGREGLRHVWTGTLNDENVDRTIQSPARHKTIELLLAGHSAVWVMIDCDDDKKNDAAWNRLHSELARMKSIIELPDQRLIEIEEEYRADNPIELRVDFAAIRIKRDDAAESFFRASLENTESDLTDFNEPIAIPIFGRGRTYFALLGKGINAEMIEENCRFVCGACSCQVKQGNPGKDMLMAVDWDAHIRGTAMKDVQTPELTGLGVFDLDSLATDQPRTTVDSEVEQGANAISPNESLSSNFASDHGSGAESASAHGHSAASAPVVNFDRSLLLAALAIVACASLFVVGISLLLHRGKS